MDVSSLAFFFMFLAEHVFSFNLHGKPLTNTVLQNKGPFRYVELQHFHI